MKFVCDRCGKRYATAGDPAPGKVYKLKCRGCGHLIVVKGQAGTVTAMPAVTADELASATLVTEPAQATPPGIELYVDAEPNPEEPLPTPAPEAVGARPPEQVADEAFDRLAEEPAASSSRSASPGAVAPAPGLPELELEEPPELLDQELTPPPPEKDELADFAAATAEVMAAPLAAGEAGRPASPGYRDLFDESGLSQPPQDSFTAAARASLPDAWSGVPATAAPPPPRSALPALAPPRPRRPGRSGVPIALIGTGVLALMGIAAWALTGRGGPQPAPSSEASEPRPAPQRPTGPEAGPPPAALQPAEPPPQPVVVEKPVVVERPPEPRAAPRVVERPPEPKARPAERRPEKRVETRAAERRPEPARPAPAAEPPPEPQEAVLPDGAAALTQEVVNRVVGSNRKAFATCIATAGSSGLVLDGRRVALRFTINTNGTVTYPTLDDQSLNGIEVGQCLKSAARMMIFPRFKGDPFHYEVPLVLSNN